MSEKPLGEEKYDPLLNSLAEHFKVPLKLSGFLILVTGQSGAGKNFVCKILQLLDLTFSDVERKKLNGQVIFYSSNGDGFRKFCHDVKSTSRIAQIIEERKRRYQKQYEFMPFLFLFSKIEEKFKENDVVLINGSPRSEKEFDLWRSMIDTEKDPGLFKRVLVVNLEISDETAAKRLVKRGREDSNTQSKIKKKLEAYKEGRKFLKRVKNNKASFARKSGGKIEFITIDAEQDKETTVRQFLEELYKFNEIRT